MQRILIVDDDEPIADALQAQLAPYYQVARVFSGSDAVRLARTFSPDGLIIDVYFRDGMSGLDTMRVMRKLFPLLRILVFSATHHDENIRAKATEFGATFHKKPLEDINVVHILMGNENGRSNAGI